MNASFESINAQGLLNEFRSGDFNALLQFRYFVCSKYKPALLAANPQDEILSDPDTCILPADEEDDRLVFELLQTDLVERDLQCIAHLHQQMQVAKQEYGFYLPFHEESAITKMAALTIHVLVLKKYDETKKLTACDIEESKHIIEAFLPQHKQEMVAKVEQYLADLETALPSISFEYDSRISVYLLNAYFSQNCNVEDYICMILTRVKQHHNEVISNDNTEKLANSFYIILYYARKMKQQEGTNANADYAAFATRLEQQMLACMFLSGSEKIRLIETIKADCAKFAKESHPILDQLLDAIYQFLNRVIFTSNQKLGTELPFFKISPCTLIQDHVASLNVMEM